MEVDRIRARIDELLAPHEVKDHLAEGTALFQGALSVMGSVYGVESPHVNSLKSLAEEVFANRSKESGHLRFRIDSLTSATRGALTNLKAELEAGLLQGLERKFTSDVLTDLVQLAKQVLTDSGDNSKNVAAVLAAAAFEDVIRRMGSSFAGVMGRDDLKDVINALKKTWVLVSPQLGIALSYLSFRNHALHAEWGKIDRASVNSVLGFVEALLVKHFSS